MGWGRLLYITLPVCWCLLVVCWWAICSVVVISGGAGMVVWSVIVVVPPVLRWLVLVCLSSRRNLESPLRHMVCVFVLNVPIHVSIVLLFLMVLLFWWVWVCDVVCVMVWVVLLV